jgi:predicted TIM-barrel fold metal-dependent hydrolase
VPDDGLGWPTRVDDLSHPLAQLPLRRWRPRPKLVVPEHLVARAAVPAIDAHNHLGRWLTGGWAAPDVGALLALMDACNIAAIVNLDGRWGEELQDNLDRYDRAHPGRFATFCHVDWSVLAHLPAAEAAEALAASLRRSVEAGARGLKIWKDLGLHVRDQAGSLVLLDDPRLGPLVEAAGDLGLPVAIHTADPAAFFDPVDDRNERLEELLAVPDWSFADVERFPRFGQLMGALESLVGDHPHTTFVGVHMGCYAEDLGWVRRMLTSYPNFHVDIAARLAEIGRQPRATRQLVRDFPDRVLFGTDCFPPDADVYRRHFRFLETDDEAFPYEENDPPSTGRWTISGIHLPTDVQRAVYHDNAARLLPALVGSSS